MPCIAPELNTETLGDLPLDIRAGAGLVLSVVVAASCGDAGVASGCCEAGSVAALSNGSGDGAAVSDGDITGCCRVTVERPRRAGLASRPPSSTAIALETAPSGGKF
jgi:hypothetical protein